MDKPDGQGFSGMGFIIKKIVVHRKPTEVRQNEQHYNMKRSSWDEAAEFGSVNEAQKALQGLKGLLGESLTAAV